MSAELVAKLFKFKKQITYGDDIKLWLRIPGDQIVDDARTEALLASRKLRREVRNPDSREYLLHIDLVEDIEEDDLYEACISLASRDVMRDYVNTNPKPALPEMNDYPTLAEQEEHAAAKAQREIDYAESLRIYVEGWRAQYMAGLKKGGMERAKNIYKKLKTDRVAEEVFSETFEDALLARSVFVDEGCTELAFTFEELKNAPVAFKRFLREEFSSLNLSGDDLKK